MSELEESQAKLILLVALWVPYSLYQLKSELQHELLLHTQNSILWSSRVDT